MLYHALPFDGKGLSCCLSLSGCLVQKHSVNQGPQALWADLLNVKQGMLALQGPDAS
jgi:hypothetical protein